jgi:hypothetical protein
VNKGRFLMRVIISKVIKIFLRITTFLFNENPLRFRHGDKNGSSEKTVNKRRANKKVNLFVKIILEVGERKTRGKWQIM